MTTQEQRRCSAIVGVLEDADEEGEATGRDSIEVTCDYRVAYLPDEGGHCWCGHDDTEEYAAHTEDQEVDLDGRPVRPPFTYCHECAMEDRDDAAHPPLVLRHIDGEGQPVELGHDPEEG